VVDDWPRILSIVFVFWTPLLEGDEGRRGINAV
jgi:hypothetical protein